MTGLALMFLGQIYLSGDGGYGALVRRVSCTGAGVSCSTGAGVGTIAVAGGGSVPSACSAGQALTSNGTDLSCTSSITANGLACSGQCVSNGEIEGIAGSKVEGAVATAFELASDPTDCQAGQYATGTNAAGVPTCSQVATSQLSGTITNAQIGAVDGAKVTTGTVDPARLGSGTPGAGNFLRGDGTWAVPSGGSGVTTQVTGSNYTNSTVTPSTVMSWSVSANTQYGFACTLTAQGTTTSLPRFNLTGPASTSVSFLTQRFTTTSAQTLLALQALSASAQTAACTSACNATQLPTLITGSLIVGGSGGTVLLQAASSTAGQTVTVFRGSFCRVF